MMREGSKAMGVMTSTMMYLLVTFLTFFAINSINLVTSGLPSYHKVALDSSNPKCFSITVERKCDPKTFKASDYPSCPVRCVFVDYEIQGDANYLQIYNLLLCLWCLHFIITLGQWTLARTFSTYYWSLSKPQTVHRSLVSKSLFRMLRYQTVSMAFGAVFLTMIQGIRAVLSQICDQRWTNILLYLPPAETSP